MTICLAIELRTRTQQNPMQSDVIDSCREQSDQIHAADI